MKEGVRDRQTERDMQKNGVFPQMQRSVGVLVGVLGSVTGGDQRTELLLPRRWLGLPG